MSIFRLTIVAAFMTLLGSLFIVSSTAIPTASAACRDTNVLTFPAWHAHLKKDDNCRVQLTKLNDFWVIVLNVIEMLLQIVVYSALGYIIWSGFKYMKSRGDPTKVANAQQAITDAVIGLIIALSATAIVNVVAGAIV